jgi:transcriptional regulator with XRE-family HTH domain
VRATEISFPLLTQRLLTVDDAGVTTETVGERIRRLRLSRGLSQRSLAGPGVSYAYISRIENGGRKPSLKTLRYLAGRLGVDPDYLEEGQAIPARKERELRLVDAEIEVRLGGDLERAEERLHALLDEDVRDGLEVRIRAALGAILARQGEHEEATRELERVVESGGVRPETRPDVYETLSRCYLATSAGHVAVRLLEECIAEVDRDERHVTAQIRYRSFLATAHAAMGATERARKALDEATTRAERFGRFSEQVALQWERARLFWMQGDGEAALSTLTYARALADIADDTLQIARAHLFSAQILNLERRAAEARPHLEDASSTSATTPSIAARSAPSKRNTLRQSANRDGRSVLPGSPSSSSPTTSCTPRTPGTRWAPPTPPPATSTPPTPTTTARSRRSPSAGSGGKRSMSPAPGPTSYAPAAARNAPTPCSSGRRPSGSASRSSRCLRRESDTRVPRPGPTSSS